MSDNFNRESPQILHVDLNSAFATIEQQARPLLRDRPIAIVNRATEHTSVITASYEAKANGVKVGMRLKEAKILAPGLIAIESDPPKYRYVYKKLLSILGDYSPNAIMKSIDEGVIDLHGSPTTRSPVEIGLEIKQRLRAEVGSAMRCNVGIGPSRFLAKTAASLHKPDGLDVVEATNLRQTYASMKLTDITGIAGRYERRLNAVGIFTPLEFLDASLIALERVVFKSIVGHQWYERLRGYEVDDRTFETKTIGRQYVLEDRNLSREVIKARLHLLCESVGVRLRIAGLVARGVYVYARESSGRYWHACKMMQAPFFSDKAINNLAQELFNGAPASIREIGIRCYGVSNNDNNQLSLFGDLIAREMRLSSATDKINERFGDGTIHSADTLASSHIIKQKVSFGSTRYL